ncbi:MAG: hypothetical protein CMN21_15800 [Rubinisphaera sp.]|nr:hypothetical protein [Rubinisphaera sp.]|tara:strand:+ start:1464 stop:1916 length:453 start_codon:yes stop_codon:yes gene_type:complete
MVRKLLILSTAFSMLLHALLGCCAHHAHACHHEHISSQNLKKLDADHQHCHHKVEVNSCESETSEQDRKSNSTTHSQEDSIPCDETDCAYVSVAPANEFKSAIALTFTGLFELNPVNVHISDPSLGIESLLSLYQPNTLRLRAHLQVWSL